MNHLLHEGWFVRWDEKPGSMADTVPVWEFAPAKSAVLSGAADREHNTSIRYGVTRKYWTWEGKAWSIGTVTYTSITGDQLTVPLFTCDRQAAADYHAKLK